MSGDADLKRRMEGALAAFERDISSVRAGRARPTMLDPVVVTAYGGSKVPINQLGAISTPDPRTLSVLVWDASQAQSVDKAIREAGLGLNPVLEGNVVRIPVPPLSQDRRNELAKTASKYAEGGRVAVRNIRRDGIETLKKQEKDKEISEDERKRGEKTISEATEEFIKKIDTIFADKEKDIKSV